MNNKKKSIYGEINKKDILLIVLSVAILFFMVLSSYLLPEKNNDGEEVIVLTDRQNYEAGDNLRVKIENNMEKSVCFSSCYPYYIEKNEEGWKAYNYEDCKEDDVVDNCIDSGSTKAFELEIPEFFKGFHRLMIKACVGCGPLQPFNAEKELFSNQFNIN